MRTQKYENFKVGTTVKFNQSIEEYEVGFEDGMMATIHKIEFDDIYRVINIYFDFSKYEEFNKKLMTANYYDDNGKPSLRWDETSFYPKNKIESCFFDYEIEPPFEVTKSCAIIPERQLLNYVTQVIENYPPQVCKHTVALDILNIIEKNGGTLNKNLVKAISDCDDSATLNLFKYEN